MGDSCFRAADLPYACNDIHAIESRIMPIQMLGLILPNALIPQKSLQHGAFYYPAFCMIKLYDNFEL